MVLNIPKDSFIESLSNSIEHLSSKVNADYLYARTGHGARFTLAMNVKTGKEIGHPSSEYIWDISSVVDQCFPDAGITARMFVNEEYGTLARRTSAQENRILPSNVKIVETEELKELSGNLILPLPTGLWKSVNNIAELDLDESAYPFGPIVLEIIEFKMIETFPKSTLRYLTRTIERGEEPMEVEGQGHYSAVSGWKAYARWMQSFAVPLPNIQHPFLSKIPQMLLRRRVAFSNYWKRQVDNYTNKETQFAQELAEKYDNIASVIQSHLPTISDLEQVRSIYFAEQKTHSTYKRINNYINS